LYAFVGKDHILPSPTAKFMAQIYMRGGHWQSRLQAGIFDHDFETDPENDPILCEIMERLQAKWAEEAL